MRKEFVTSLPSALRNIERYQLEIMQVPELARRAPFVRAWYASRQESGEWLFAPSKVIGYQFASAQEYFDDAKSGSRDGRDTERVLSQWFQEIEPDTELGTALAQALREYLGKFGVAPNSLARINLPRDFVRTASTLQTSTAKRGSLLERVTSHPDVCGGRPVIRGTRMRVVDILEALAHGATREELLADFDYLSTEDITAALLYAAGSTDHRVLRSA
ncbi:MAG: DUF433 domain-containing protein [Pseudomonadota bacterium]|jgi:uncharacterized protein (DUF433 family)